MGRKRTPSFPALAGMGITVALCVAAGVGGGYWLDEELRTGPLLTFVGLALGLVAAGVAAWLEITSFF